MKTKFIFALFILCSLAAQAQMKINFQSADGLDITADLYYSSPRSPYVIMFHEEGSSRGEFQETALRLQRLSYNCLAVDLRSGKESNFIQNETSEQAKKNGKKQEFWEGGKDILAAINYAYNKSNEPVILMGSIQAGSLCLHYGTNNKKVKAIIAFSPGNYFGKKFDLSKRMKQVDKPAFIASTQTEAEYLEKLQAEIQNEKIELFSPSKSEGKNGSKALWSKSEGNTEYWFGLTMFFKNLE